MDEYFAAGGALARAMPGYRPRAGQLELAQTVSAALAGGEVLFAEAGTGTGKTLAYLVPALTSGKRVVISTGTRNLQDQLYNKDLPLVREALGQPVSVALLKGRGNYLCLHRLALTRDEGRLPDRASVAELGAVERWAEASGDGDLAGCEALREDSPLRPRITSTADNCLGTRCALYEQCHVVRARQAAAAADLVIVNHHLLLSDLALKEEGFGDLLGEVDAVVVDEAHQLPELAGRFFGRSLSSRQLANLGDDVLAEAGGAGIELAPLVTLVQRLVDGSAALREALSGEADRYRFDREDARQVAALEDLRLLLDAIVPALEPAAAEPGVARAVERGRDMISLLDAFLDGEEGSGMLHWVELRGRGFQLHASPVDAGQELAAATAAQGAAWVLLSATLSVAGDFEHFRARSGLAPDRTLSLPSPFSSDQAVLLLPAGLPAPGSWGHTETLMRSVLPLLEAAEGRSFLLFTSYAALQRAHEHLAAHTDLELLVQGSLPRDALLARFREAPGRVLLGTASFWEGVDVRGAALAMVVIDKLPFAAPGDPLLQARLAALAEAGEDPFSSYQLPQAVLALRQGVGRLLRDEQDRGLIVLGDPRISERGYGRLFLDSLPGYPRTRDVAAAQRFLLASIEAMQAAGSASPDAAVSGA